MRTASVRIFFAGQKCRRQSDQFVRKLLEQAAVIIGWLKASILSVTESKKRAKTALRLWKAADVVYIKYNQRL